VFTGLKNTKGKCVINKVLVNCQKQVMLSVQLFYNSFYCFHYLFYSRFQFLNNDINIVRSSIEFALVSQDICFNNNKSSCKSPAHRVTSVPALKAVHELLIHLIRCPLPRHNQIQRLVSHSFLRSAIVIEPSLLTSILVNALLISAALLVDIGG